MLNIKKKSLREKSFNDPLKSLEYHLMGPVWIFTGSGNVLGGYVFLNPLPNYQTRDLHNSNEHKTKPL